jgi:hypothetical protein
MAWTLDNLDRPLPQVDPICTRPPGRARELELANACSTLLLRASFPRARAQHCPPAGLHRGLPPAGERALIPGRPVDSSSKRAPNMSPVCTCRGAGQIRFPRQACVHVGLTTIIRSQVRSPVVRLRTIILCWRRCGRLPSGIQVCRAIGAGARAKGPLHWDGQNPCRRQEKRHPQLPAKGAVIERPLQSEDGGQRAVLGIQRLGPCHHFLQWHGHRGLLLQADQRATLAGGQRLHRRGAQQGGQHAVAGGG